MSTKVFLHFQRISSSKSNQDMEKWYKKQPFFSEKRLKKIKKWVKQKQFIDKFPMLELKIM